MISFENLTIEALNRCFKMMIKMLKLWAIFASITYMYCTSSHEVDDTEDSYTPGPDDCENLRVLVNNTAATCKLNCRDEISTNEIEEIPETNVENVDKVREKLTSIRCLWSTIVDTDIMVNRISQDCQKLFPEQSYTCGDHTGVTFLCNLNVFLCTFIKIDEMCPNSMTKQLH